MLLVIFAQWFLETEKKTQTSEWFKSKEVMKTLKIRAYDLMILCETAKLKFTKQGNAIFYALENVLNI